MFLLLGVFGRFMLRFLWFVLLLVLVVPLRSLVSDFFVGLPGLGTFLLVVLWLVSFALILGLGMVRLFIFLRMLLSRGLSFSVVGLVVSYPVLDGIFRNGLTLSRDLELGAQWGAIVSAGPCGPLCSANLAVSPAVGLSSFGDHVRVLYDVVVDFLHKVVVSRKDVAVRGWRSWMLEDDKVHPYRWLKPDLVAPALFLCCDPCLTVDGSGILSDPDRIDEQFRKAWLPFFCRVGRGVADLSVFDREVGGWLPRLGEFDCPPLLGSDLYYVVQHKRASASGLDGWGWRDLKAFPEAWFDWLAVVLSRVESDGVWPEGLLDAYVTMIPKTDGDATPLGQRPLCVLPAVYRIWASVRLRHLDSWLRLGSLFLFLSAGGGRGSVDAWYSTALDFEEVLSGLSESHVHVFVADVVKSFDTVDRGVLDLVLGRFGSACLVS